MSEFQFKQDWCAGILHDEVNTVYMPDKSCSCGIKKHHYHCGDCGGLTQIG